MDTHGFASLAQVRVLLIPVGPISRPVFDKWATEIRTFEEIRLGDIPSDNKGERARFMPSPLSRGYLHLSFPSHPPPPSYAPLSLFRPSHFPLGLIGIATCSQNDSLSSILAQFNAAVSELFPDGSTFPLAKNCFVFEEGDGNTNLNVGNELPGLVVIPSLMGNKKLYIGTLLAELCSNILGEFATVVGALESPQGNEYLNSTMFPGLPLPLDFPPTLDGDTSTRRESLPPNVSRNSQPDLNTAGALLRKGSPTPLALKRTSSLGPGAPSPASSNFRHASLGMPPAKKRLTGIGAASSHGRLFKILGDLFLLAGRCEDALVWYTEAIALCRLPYDAPWHASALEGLAVLAVVGAWAEGHGLNSSFSNTAEPWGDVADKMIQATALYTRGPTSIDGTQDYTFLSYLYTTAVLRHAALIFAVWSAKGWGPLAFTTMLQPGPNPVLPPTLATPEGASYLGIERLCKITGISRAQIAGIVAQAHGPWLLHLGPRERLATLEAIAGLYACLGYKRKEAYILRELLGSVMDLLVCGRGETTQAAHSRITSAGLGIQGANVPGGASGGTVAIRENESTEGNESLLRLTKYICRVHGVDLEAVKLLEMHSESSDSLEVGEDAAATDPHEPFGWPELQVGIVREAIAVAEALPDYPSVAQFALSALKTLHPVLTSDDQSHLYSTATRALNTARRRGDPRYVEYWSPPPVTSVEVSPLPFVRFPLEKPMSILSTRNSDVAAPLKETFLYNPRRSTSGQGITAVVVQNEDLEFVVTLRNPFVFNLELQSLSLSTDGVPFESKPIPVVVPANSFHPVTIVGQARAAGVLTIKGAHVQAVGGAAREFRLPLSTDEEEARQARRRSALTNEVGRSKYGGLDSRPWEASTKRASRGGAHAPTKARYLECKVVPEQPLLRIRRTSLTHGALMLYNGERSTVRITLENVSSLPIDFIKLTFDDSTIPPAQQALADGELSVFETYETEYSLINRPAFSWDEKKARKTVGPGDKTAITVNCFGKAGCISGAIQISYAYVHRHKDSLEQPIDVFQTRQLSYPVQVTVYNMLECHGMDIVTYTHQKPQQGPDDTDVDGPWADVDDDAGWCIFSVDVRNTYGLPFEVSFERAQEGTAPRTVTSVVAPGSTSRILLPLKKILLPAEQISQPIPTLSDRQFVVDKSGLTSRQESEQRELFWYREEVFKCIKARWREAGGIRAGELSLRQQRMTMPMLEALRTETARIHLSLAELDGPASSDGPRVRSLGVKYVAPANEFIVLKATVTNLSPTPLTLALDLALDPFDHVLFEGGLLDIPVGHLASGQSTVVDIAVCFVAQGRFEIGAEVRMLDGGDERVGVGVMKVTVED